MGMYLGPSPVHIKNIALVMDLDTGLVSPHFHVMFYNEFQTVRQYKSTPSWKVKTRLLSERELERSKRQKDKMSVIIPDMDVKLKY